MSRVAAAIVSFHPNAAQLTCILHTLRRQVEQVVLVNNAPLSADLSSRIDLLSDFVTQINLPTNIGLASAQNIALRHAAAQGATHALLLDQDSSPPPDLVSELLSADQELRACGIALAAVGPRLIDADSGSEWPFEDTWLGATNAPPLAERFVIVDYLRASGSLIDLDVWRRSGEFLDYLFIDHIDLEWCLRARAMGYLSVGVRSIAMSHLIGEGFVRFLGRMHPLHSAQRNYYVFRNSVALLKLPHVPGGWKRNEMLRLLPRAIFYSLQHQHPLQHFRQCLNGLRDGLHTPRNRLVPSSDD